MPHPLALLLAAGLYAGGTPPAHAQDRIPFDGRSLDGWEGDPSFWRVEDGVLVGESTPETPCAETTYLTWTGGEVGDFELSLEFRIHGGNSGVQFRSRRAQGYQVEGYQADMDAAGEWTGGLYEQGGRGVIVRRGERVRLSGERRDVARFGDAAELLGRAAPDAWRSYRILAQGPRVEVWLDGVLTCELRDEDARAARASGVLALQLHAGPPMRVEYRAMRLRVPRMRPLDERDWSFVQELSAATPNAGKARPRWIWTGSEARADERAWFFREFELEDVPAHAWLEGSCDNGMQVRLNGEPVLQVDEWTRPLSVDVAARLRAGRNLLAVAARNEGGPAGLQLALDLGRLTERVVTDGAWRCAHEEPAGWKAAGFVLDGLSDVHDHGPLGGGTWGTLPAPQAPEREGALPAEEVEVAEGYAVELVYSVPKALYGSWVALTFDPSGRAIVSHERGGLYRLTLPATRGDEVALEVLDDELGGAQGLLALEHDLYAVVHPRGEHVAGLYRFGDRDGDDRFETRELLLELEGRGEHGPHAVLLEPGGGRLVLLAGNHTRLPELVHSRVPRTWAEDQLLPRRGDPGGHAQGVLAPGGWVVRTGLDGDDVELVACGMRNAYDMAFGPDGDLFTYDADMEWDVGLGWYRAPRVVHMASGADFGWRHGSGKWPVVWPDTLPSAAETDLSSPVGVLFGGSLSAFAERERRALFIADWAYGRILAVDFEPSGSSWSGVARPFVSGRPLPLTDLAAGPEGDLWFTVGGRGTQSGLYRVRRSSGAFVSAPAVVSWPGWALRARRRALEAFHGRVDPRAVEEAFRSLDDPDPFLASAARVALESQPLAEWRARALAERRPRAAVQAAVALAHTGVPSLAAAVSELLARVPFEDVEPRTQVGLLRAAGLVEIRLGGAPRAQRAALRERLEAAFPSGVDRVDRELCRLLVRLRSERVLDVGLDLLEAAEDSEEATHYAFCLVEVPAGWDEDARARFLAWLEAAPERFAGGASLRGYLDELRGDARARLGLDVEPIEAGAQVAAATARPFVRAWSVSDLEGDIGELRSGRSFDRGREAYVAARCAECHSVRGTGGRTGPELTGVGSRLSARDLLEALIEPSRVVSDQYQDTELLTIDDELLVGRAIGEEGDVLLFLTLPPQEEVIEIPLAEVASRRPHPLSRMPEGLLDTLQREELLDLFAFLLAGGDPDDPRFDR